jgi:hypothetical protein
VEQACDVFAKLKNATPLCGIRDHIADCMALPEVLQDARVHIFDMTRKHFDELMHPPPPALN